MQFADVLAERGEIIPGSAAGAFVNASLKAAVMHGGMRRPA